MLNQIKLSMSSCKVGKLELVDPLYGTNQVTGDPSLFDRQNRNPMKLKLERKNCPSPDHAYIFRLPETFTRNLHNYFPLINRY